MSEMPQCYRLVKRKARKDHKCCECRGLIPKGESYNYHSGIWNGEPESYKVCVDCDALREKIRNECDLYPDEAPALANMVYDVSDYDECTGYRAEFNAICDKRRSAINQPPKDKT